MFILLCCDVNLHLFVRVIVRYMGWSLIVLTSHYYYYYFDASQLNTGKVVVVGPGARDKDGKLVPVTLKEGETVLLPEYGGTEVKLGEKEWVTASWI